MPNKNEVKMPETNKDTLRLDWLEKKSGGLNTTDEGKPHIFLDHPVFLFESIHYYGVNYRDAIDVAMRADEEGGK